MLLSADDRAMLHDPSPLLNRSDKTLSTPAFGALINVMHEAGLPRFGLGAGKAHLGSALHALWIFVETLGLALWHCPPHGWLTSPGKVRFHFWKVSATSLDLFVTD
jgi:hypothetical protein